MREFPHVLSPFLLAALVLAAGGAPAPAPADEATKILERAQASILGDVAAYTLRMTVSRTGKSPRVVQ